LIEELIILFTMIVLFEMAQFVDQNVVDAIQGGLYETGIERDQTGEAATTPACLHEANS